MWYRDPQDIIAQERRIAGLETSLSDADKLVWDCAMSPGAMFARALASRR